MGDSYKIVNCPEFGDYIIADQVFEEGETVFKEEPLLSSPLEDRVIIDEPELCCVGCYKIVSSNPKRCSKCGFPVCSKVCSQDEFHQKLECRIIAKRGIVLSQTTFGYLKYLRIILSKDVYPNRYEKFAMFSTSFDLELEKFSLRAEEDPVPVWEFLTHDCHLKVTLSEVKKVWTALKINSFLLFVEDTYGIRYRGYAIFRLCCKLSHSCNANLDWFFSKTETEDGTVKWHLHIVATRRIQKGDILSIAYTPSGLNYGTGFRREKYQSSLPFRCLCPRCLSPTEEGTHFSSPKCPKCKCGYFHPEEPLSSLTCIWKCSHCTFSKNGGDVEKAISKCEKYISRFMNEDSSSLDRLDDFIDKNSGIALHPNHFLIFQATVHWLLKSDWTAKLITQTKTSEKLLEKILARYYRCIPLVKRFLPTLTIVYLEASAVAAISAFAFKSDDSESITFNYTNPRFNVRYCKMIVSHLSQANFWIQRQSGYRGWEKHKAWLSGLYDKWARRFDLYKEDTLYHEINMQKVALCKMRAVFR